MPERDLSSPPVRHPPFTGMRAVEAAVRNKSYSAAARELQITHAAISQAIKKLEIELGLKLFERSGQMMEPSDAALHLAKAYSEAQATLYRSLGDVREQAAPTRVVVALPAGFARFWFAPRIGLLSEQMPRLRIEVRTAPADGGVEEECSIRLGEAPVEDDADWVAERVAGIALFPLCSPDFLRRQGPLTLKSLSTHSLLAERRWPWSLWFEAMGQRRPWISHDLLFDDPNVTLDAAVRGHGVMLTHIFHAEEHLRQGLLVAPLDRAAQTADSLYLSWRRSGGEPLDRVAGWLLQSLRASADAAEGFFAG